MDKGQRRTAKVSINDTHLFKLSEKKFNGSEREPIKNAIKS